MLCHSTLCALWHDFLKNAVHLQNYFEEYKGGMKDFFFFLYGMIMHPFGPVIRVFDPQPCEGGIACYIRIF